MKFSYLQVKKNIFRPLVLYFLKTENCLYFLVTLPTRNLDNKPLGHHDT